MTQEKILEGRKYMSDKYGIPIEQCKFYHSGICFDRAAVTTMEAAKKIASQVTGTVNGGYMHGVPLGQISKVMDWHEVTC